MLFDEREVLADHRRAALGRATACVIPTVELNAFVVMPNHVHGVVMLNTGDVGAPLAGAPLSVNRRVRRILCELDARRQGQALPGYARN